MTNGHGGSASLSPPAIETIKHAARAEAKRRRAAIYTTESGADQRLARLFLSALDPEPGAVIAGYAPIGTEIDVRPLMTALDQRGCALCLPCVVARGRPLAFRRWTPETPLQRGAFGIPEPPADAPLAEPRLLIVPLLAFDRKGGRLGYGQGFYDRTLAALKEVVTVGVGYAGQETPIVPCAAHDSRLDWVITDREAIATGP